MTAEAPPTSAPPGLIQTYLNAVVQELHRGARTDLIQRLKDAVESRRDTRPTVVVVGETKRGKSSLINSLIGQSLSPIGVDVATGCTLVFHSAPQMQAAVRSAIDGSLYGIPMDDIATFATNDGNPQNVRGVHAVLVGTDAPLLEHLTLIDTPGVGGLNTGHGRLAMQAASTADALLFVLDAGAPISQPELEFLAEVCQHVDSVTVVLTKVDEYGSWRTMAEDDHKLLSQRVDRLAGAAVLPVSNLLAGRGARDESGVPELEALLLKEVAGRVDTLRFANILRVAMGCLEELIRTQTAKLAYLSGQEDALPALERERARLLQLKADPRKLLQELDKGLRRLSLDRSDSLNRGMRELRLNYDNEVAVTKGVELEDLPGRLLSEVTALSDRLAEDTAMGIVTVVRDLIDAVDDQAPDFLTLGQLRSKDLAGDVALAAPAKRSSTRVEHLSTLISFSSGRSIGSVVASLPVFALGGIPFMVAGLGVGAAFAWQMHRGRGDVTRQNEFKTWMREQLAEAERQLNNDFARAMIDVGDEVRAGLTERIDDRRRETEIAIRDCEAALAKERGVREAEAASVRESSTRSLALLERGANFHQELITGADRVGERSG